MRVVVAMSGGVDSSVAAALLKEQGHEVLGMTLELHTASPGEKCGRCCSPLDVDDARAVADQLQIPFYVVRARELFEEKIVTPFIDAYLSGQTPLPCAACNREMKFGFLLDRARRLGAVLATGHYARVDRTADGRYRLRRGVDVEKDQSYFLYELGQEELAHVLFPLGDFTKIEVRAHADRFHLPTAAKPESMELCFVPDGNYAAFLERRGAARPPGDIVDERGAVLGKHGGIHKVTVGQRRGLSLAHGERLYVSRIEAATNRIVVGSAADAVTQSFELGAVSWVGGAPGADEPLLARLRHRHPGVGATLEPLGAARFRVQLESAQRGVSPGQASVFYRGDEVVGGGTIAPSTKN